MADVKSAMVRGATNTAPARVDAQMRVQPRPPVQSRAAVEGVELPPARQVQIDPSSALVSEFIAPSPRTMAWLSNPRMTATLEAASKALAPNGASEDATDRYAASVIETHLVARRRLSKLTNSLLKT